MRVRACRQERAESVEVGRNTQAGSKEQEAGQMTRGLMRQRNPEWAETAAGRRNTQSRS